MPKPMSFAACFFTVTPLCRESTGITPAVFSLFVDSSIHKETAAEMRRCRDGAIPTRHLQNSKGYFAPSVKQNKILP